MEVSTVYSFKYFENPLQRDSTRNSMFVGLIVVLVEISQREIICLTTSHNVKGMRSMLVSLESFPYMRSDHPCWLAFQPNMLLTPDRAHYANL